MAYKVQTRDEHLQNDGRPKRILALDGGGLRGILTLGYLKKIELEFNPSMQHIDRMLLRDS